MNPAKMKKEKRTAHASPLSNIQSESNGTRNSTGEAFADAEGSLHALTHDMKALIQGLQKLRQLGVEDLKLPLPKIVVVGDQSTGKSSLIEGMSEIKVPRSAGTCTRCPLEIILTEDASQWKCQVSICKKYVYDGKTNANRKGPSKTEKPSKNRPLGPWVRQDTEQFHFHTIDHKDDVPAVLRLAQLAVLNPGTSHDVYKPGQAPAPSESLQVKFSPNIVRLDISGPNLPDLAFFDLPGVINVSDTAEDGFLVELVRNLVKDYIKCGDSINLLALPMSDDVQNSSAFKLIRELRAEGRTTGCLTKPDRRQEGESLDQWTYILQGHRFRLGYGYFVVKNDPDPEVDHVTARQDEMCYFETEEPWTTTLRSFSDRFGTSMLQSTLSQRLADQIKMSLPRIEDQVRQKIIDIDAQLTILPKPVPKDAPLAVMMELVNFDRGLTKQFDSGDKDFLFESLWHNLASEFRRHLADSRPLIIVPYMQKRATAPDDMNQIVTPSSTSSRTLTECIDLSSDEDLSHTSAGDKRQRTVSPATPIKRRRTGTGQFESKRFILAEVKSIIHRAYAGGIPSLVHPKAIEDLIKLSMVHWDGLLSQFLLASQKQFKDMLYSLAKETFQKRSGTAFYEDLHNVIDSYLQALFKRQEVLAKQLLSWEMDRPKTLNEDGLASARNTAFDALKESFKLQRAHDALDLIEKKNGKPTTGQTREDKAAKLPEAQLGPDKYDLEIQALSNVKGYYSLAYNRFVDVLCSSMYCETFKKCRAELFETLKDRFNVTGPDANERLVRLLQPSAEDKLSRDRLLKEKVTLMKAQDCIKGLQ